MSAFTRPVTCVDGLAVLAVLTLASTAPDGFVLSIHARSTTRSPAFTHKDASHATFFPTRLSSRSSCLAHFFTPGLTESTHIICLLPPKPPFSATPLAPRTSRFAPTSHLASPLPFPHPAATPTPTTSPPSHSASCECTKGRRGCPPCRASPMFFVAGGGLCGGRRRRGWSRG